MLPRADGLTIELGEVGCGKTWLQCGLWVLELYVFCDREHVEKTGGRVKRNGLDENCVQQQEMMGGVL